jgi:hypothetical protein
MNLKRLPYALLSLAVMASLSCGLGCSGNTHAAFLPPEQIARQALEAALSAWQSGAPPGKIEGETSDIQALDFKWRAGHKLASYEILDAEPGDSGPTWFTVKLVMKTPPGEVKARYAVIGKDPLWVYREEDYKQACGM